MASYFPLETLYELGDAYNPDDITYAIVWNHPKGDLARYKNLKAVFSTGAGTEHFDQDPNLPNAPIFRLVDPNMAEDMALYALYWSLHFHRKFETYRTQQTAKKWERYATPPAHTFHICVLGQGAMGQFISEHLAKNKFKVSGWSRSPKDVDGVQSFSGETALTDTLAETDVLISCLPLNDVTRGYLDKARLSALKHGAGFINISRGPIVETKALLDLLDTRHISAAVLDVFDQEPLDDNSPLWDHPNVHVTPHMSGMTNTQTAAKIIAENIAKVKSGKMPDNMYKDWTGRHPSADK